MRKQARIIVFGRVQGAAYRDNVERIAYGLHITGTIRNLEDETVEVICEGEVKPISEFLERIQIKQWPIMVEGIRPSYRKPTGEFKKFRQIRTKLTTRDIIDRLDLGMNHMSDMKEQQDKTLIAINTMDSNMGKSFDRSDKKQGMTIKAIHSMDSNMGRHFDRLDRKYGEFGKTMKGVAKDMKGVKGSMTGMASDIKAIRNTATAPKKRKTPITA